MQLARDSVIVYFLVESDTCRCWAVKNDIHSLSRVSYLLSLFLLSMIQLSEESNWKRSNGKRSDNDETFYCFLSVQVLYFISFQPMNWSDGCWSRCEKRENKIKQKIVSTKDVESMNSSSKQTNNQKNAQRRWSTCIIAYTVHVEHSYLNIKEFSFVRSLDK